MRYGVGVHYAPQPSPPPPPPIHSPSPTLINTGAGSVAQAHSMIFSFFLALFLPCAGMSSVFIVYICLLWYASNNTNRIDYRSQAVKPAEVKGLSATYLEKLPRTTGKELVMGSECAVCLDEIEGEQPARLIPGCNHGFHIQCADTWLSKHPVCPVCRANLDSQFFDALENPC
ncbi:hypothetical protein ACOSP7_011193 [Xanthoceras sorbifolium]